MSNGFSGQGGVAIASCYYKKCDDMRTEAGIRGHSICVCYFPGDDTRFAMEYGKLIEMYAKHARAVVVIVGDAGEEGETQQVEMTYLNAHDIVYKKMTIDEYRRAWPAGNFATGWVTGNGAPSVFHHVPHAAVSSIGVYNQPNYGIVDLAVNGQCLTGNTKGDLTAVLEVGSNGPCTGIHVKEQANYGIVDIRLSFGNGETSQWGTNNANGDVRELGVPAGCAVTGLAAREQYGYGVIDISLFYSGR
mmetsp:Transcript_20975/g.47764  ORF Transcript_20975/g.47764 Transcript_20975/m.47764 type:complete len:247 (-) Transcript_20975:83-823(-)